MCTNQKHSLWPDGDFFPSKCGLGCYCDTMTMVQFCWWISHILTVFHIILLPQCFTVETLSFVCMLSLFNSQTVLFSVNCQSVLWVVSLQGSLLAEIRSLAWMRLFNHGGVWPEQSSNESFRPWQIQVSHCGPCSCSGVLQTRQDLKSFVTYLCWFCSPHSDSVDTGEHYDTFVCPGSVWREPVPFSKV